MRAVGKQLYRRTPLCLPSNHHTPWLLSTYLSPQRKPSLRLSHRTHAHTSPHVAYTNSQRTHTHSRINPGEHTHLPMLMLYCKNCQESTKMYLLYVCTVHIIVLTQTLIRLSEIHIFVTLTRIPRVTQTGRNASTHTDRQSCTLTFSHAPVHQYTKKHIPLNCVRCVCSRMSLCYCAY